MQFETQLALLDRAFAAYANDRRLEALQIAMPVIHEMNREIVVATERSRFNIDMHKQLYLNIRDFLAVLPIPVPQASPLDSATAISWNKNFNAEDAYTLVGRLIRHGKLYGIGDYEQDPRAVRAMGFLSVIVANKLSLPGDHRLVLSVPSSSKSTNTLPKQLAELVATTSSRYDFTQPGTLLRRRDFGQLKNISDYDMKVRLVTGSMEADEKQCGGRKILLIDDLYDSGGTLREAARSLKAAGATEVHALVMAKTRSFMKRTMW